MSAWDELDANTLAKGKVDPELFSKPLVLPPSRPVPPGADASQEEQHKRA